MHSITLLVGEINGTLKAHIAAVAHDRAEHDGDRIDSANYRKEIRHALSNLTMQVQAITPLAERVKAIEPVVEDYKTIRLKIGVAVVIVSGAWTMIMGGLFYFGADIKALFLRMLRIS